MKDVFNEFLLNASGAFVAYGLVYFVVYRMHRAERRAQKARAPAPGGPREALPVAKPCPGCGGEGEPRVIYADERLCQSRFCPTCRRTWGGRIPA
jgi:hypothetical protein